MTEEDFYAAIVPVLMNINQALWAIANKMNTNYHSFTTAPGSYPTGGGGHPYTPPTYGSGSTAARPYPDGVTITNTVDTGEPLTASK